MDFTRMAIKKIDTASIPKAIIKDVQLSEIVATGEKFIEAEVCIYEDDVLVETVKLGYPEETERDEIVKDIKKRMKLRTKEKKQKEEQKIKDEKDSKTKIKIDELKDLEVN